MKNILVYSILLLPLLAAALFASEKVYLDNDEIQEFHGKQGKWMMITTKNQFDAIVTKHEIQPNDVLKVNSAGHMRNLMGSYAFIPYSDKYLSELESKGIVRGSIECREDHFIWPLSDVSTITSVFGLRWGEIHPGLDMPVPRGTIVRAAKDGRVVISGYGGGYGKEVVIEHRNNYITRYAHNSVNFVKVGDCVRKGQAIALVGSSGRSTGPHLHFEIRLNDIPLDPLDFLPENSLLQVSEKRLKNWR
ncbi:MAG: M23 family metallopeptidase [Spirochaetes bacterium]|jgi:hypothetical protein|nr:M23 family metallopeptidase [Spirochaetota bacterium]